MTSFVVQVKVHLICIFNLDLIHMLQMHVVGVMKMGEMAPRVGIEPISLAFRDSVLTITPHVITLTTPTCLCGSLSERTMQTNKCRAF